MKAPSGFTYRKRQGIDTFVGTLVSKDGKTEVGFDIGHSAGSRANRRITPRHFEQRTVMGITVRMGEGSYEDSRGQVVRYTVLTFVEAGCANFIARQSLADVRGLMEELVRGFRPGKRADGLVVETCMNE